LSGKPRIEKLQRNHNVDPFDCGQEDLNRFLVRFALTSQQSGSSNTFAALVEDEIVGYYTLVSGQVQYDDAPDRLNKGLARHSVPMMILAKLAVAKDWQRKRLGTGMLKDAVLRTLKAMEIAGNFRGILVHAKDEDSKRFYERFDFVPSPSDPLHLMVLLKDLRKAIDIS
jgi:GNAT superfamily N-acetyltransferase